VAEIDTLRALTRKSQAYAVWLDARSRAALARARLSDWVGEEVAPEDLESPDAPVEHSTVSTVIPRGELQAALENQAALRLESRRSGLSLLPSLNSSARVDWYRDGSVGPVQRRWMAELRLDVPIWDGGRRIQDWRAASARSREAQARAREMTARLELERVDAASQLELSIDRAVATRAARASAEEALRLAQARYHGGLLPLTELLAADSEAARARLDDITAAAATVSSRYNYLHSIGELK
jgi:outer membrane protein TolC